MNRTIALLALLALAACSPTAGIMDNMTGPPPAVPSTNATFPSLFDEGGGGPEINGRGDSGSGPG